jgi:hypothetical protein
MTWVLILLIVAPGQPPQPPVQAGVMRDEATCIVAGGGMALVLQQANPGLLVGFRCEPAGEAA